jgi:hypothetical protein
MSYFVSRLSWKGPRLQEMGVSLSLVQKARLWMSTRKRLFQRGPSIFQAIPESVIEAVSASSWARNTASQYAVALGFQPGSDAYNNAVNSGSRNLAIRFLKGVSMPETVPTVPETTTAKRQHGRPKETGSPQTTRGPNQPRPSAEGG